MDIATSLQRHVRFRVHDLVVGNLFSTGIYIISLIKLFFRGMGKFAQNRRLHSLCTNSTQSPDCTGRKKALCVGINYRGQRKELHGCVNDAMNVKTALIQRFGYREADIRVLVDDPSNSYECPTKDNLISALKWLAEDAKPDDLRFFHYSGHGDQIDDVDGNKLGRKYEAIVPLDFCTSADYITDDLLHDILIKPLPRRCHLVALIDGCNLENVLGLPYHFTCWTSYMASPKVKKVEADVIAWGSCKHSQSSVEYNFSGQSRGVMTNAFLTALEQSPNQTALQLLSSIRMTLLDKSQMPQLYSSYPVSAMQILI